MAWGLPLCTPTWRRSRRQRGHFKLHYTNKIWTYAVKLSSFTLEVLWKLHYCRIVLFEERMAAFIILNFSLSMIYRAFAATWSPLLLFQEFYFSITLLYEYSSHHLMCIKLEWARNDLANLFHFNDNTKLILRDFPPLFSATLVFCFTSALNSSDLPAPLWPASPPIFASSFTFQSSKWHE